MKRFGLCFIVFAGLFIQGCSLFAPPADQQTSSSVNGEAMLTYYTKDAGAAFAAFLQNPVTPAYSRNAGEPGEAVEVTDEDLFAGLWASLSEEERADILANPDALQIEIDETLGADADSEAGRALSRNAAETSELAVRLGFTARLKDWFKGKEVPVSYTGEVFEDIDSGIMVPANLAIQKLFLEGNWEAAIAVLNYLGMEAIEAELKAGWDAMAALDSEPADPPEGRSMARSSSDGAYGSPMTSNLGASLRNGDVLMESGKSSAYITGTYNHAGIFSKSVYATGGSTDYVHSVYTAQPNGLIQPKGSLLYPKTSEYDIDIRPDRPGYSCLDTIRLYTRQKKLAVIEPKNYTAASGASAVNYAKTIYYDPKVVYDLPLWETLGIGDSSHNLKNDYTYCSKVPYTAWKKAGVNLDSDTALGHLVVPDDLYGSVYDWYRVITIRILFWTYTHSEKIFSATSRVVTTMQR